MKKIKILFFIPTLGHGGAERVLVNLVNHMDQDTFDITVQTMFDVGIYRDQLGNGIRYIGGYKNYFRGNSHVMKLFSPKQLYKHYVKEEYDIIVSYLEGPSARVVAGCDNGNTKLICWIHTEIKTQKFLAESFRSVDEAVKCYGRYDKLIGVSKNICDKLSALYKWNSKPQTIYNTVESEIIKNKSTELVDDITFDSEKINIVAVGKVIEVKRYDRLANITKRLKDEGYPVHVYIVGSGEEQDKLEKQVNELGINDEWTFVGFKSNPYKYVKSSDLYVCSSIREGFSTAVTEALIVGTPVVSTNCSGAYELLGYNDDYGIVTENNEEALYTGIKQMLDGDNLKIYREKASIRGAEFNTEKTVEAAENLFKELLGK